MVRHHRTTTGRTIACMALNQMLMLLLLSMSSIAAGQEAPHCECPPAQATCTAADLRVAPDDLMPHASCKPDADGVIHLPVGVEAHPALLSLNLSSVVVIEGGLLISDNDLLVDVDLSTLVRVDKGDVKVNYNTALAHVTAPQLKRVEGNMQITFNTVLEAAVLPALSRISGHFRIVLNAVLATLDASALESTGEEFSVSGNKLLKYTGAGLPIDVDVDLHHFPPALSNPTMQLAGVDAEKRAAAVAFRYRPTAEACICLKEPHCTAGTLRNSAGGSIDCRPDASGRVRLPIEIRDNEVITSLDLSALTATSEAIHISNNANLRTVDLSRIEETEKIVDIGDNDALTSIDLSSLRAIASIYFQIFNNGAMQSLDVGSLQTAHGTVSVSENGALQALNMSNFTSTEGSVRVSFNSALTSLSLGSLARTGEELTIKDNTALKQLDLSALEKTVGPTKILGNGGLKVEGTKLDLTVEIKIPSFPPSQW